MLHFRLLLRFATVYSIGFTAFPALAQEARGTWLDLAYTYNDFIYKEPGVMSERGALAGVRGELGFNIMNWFSLSLGGDYQDGNMNYDGATFGGTPVKQVTKDYVRELRGLIHFDYGPMALAVGVGERYWFNDLVVSYRRRTRYNYTPIMITYRSPAYYLKIEKYIWQKGWNKSHMSDVNPAARDVEFKLGDGDGMAVEVGYRLPNAGAISTQVFFKYTTWSVKESDIQNDGTQNLIEPKNNSTILQAGIGLIF